MPASNPKIAVVAATHNRPERLDQLLDSLRAQTIPPDWFEVIIVDDASTPETSAVLQAQLDRGGLNLITLRHEISQGPGAARNLGWQTARGELIAFTDDDCAATPVWLEVALKVHEANPDAFIQGRTIANPAEVGGYNAFSHSVWVEKLGPSYETCNIVYPRDMLETHGGFDHQSFTMPGGEDTDLAWRLLEEGIEAIFAPEMLVHHAVTQIGPRGKLRIATRWHESIRLFARFPERGRSSLVHGVFWSQGHVNFFRFALALVLPRRLWPLRLWLALPYVRFAVVRRSGPLLFPWFLFHDAVEISSCVRGSIRYRTFVL